METNTSGIPYNPAAIAATGGNVPFVQRCALPMGRTATGTMSNNGAYVSGTAYGKTYPKCYLYFGAAQIAAGSAAGWYYAEGSSTTAFTVYNNTWTAGTMPTAPASKTAFVTTGPGAITGDTTEQGLVFPIAQNQLGASGWWKARARFSNNNSAGAKVARIRYSDVGGTQVAGSSLTTGTSVYLEATSVNQGATNVQEVVGTVTLAAGTSAAAFSLLAVDTTAATKPAVTTIIAVATDWQVMEWAIFELMQDGT